MDQNQMARISSLGGIIALLVIVVCLVLWLGGGIDPKVAALIGCTALTRLV